MDREIILIVSLNGSSMVKYSVQEAYVCVCVCLSDCVGYMCNVSFFVSAMFPSLSTVNNPVCVSVLVRESGRL